MLIRFIKYLIKVPAEIRAQDKAEYARLKRETDKAFNFAEIFSAQITKIETPGICIDIKDVWNKDEVFHIPHYCKNFDNCTDTKCKYYNQKKNFDETNAAYQHLKEKRSKFWRTRIDMRMKEIQK